MSGVRDYSSTAASNLSVGGISIAEGWARSSVNNAYRAGMADTANLLLDQGGSVTTTGSSNAYLLDLPTQPTAYADNLNFVCKFHAAVTGASTININGLGVKPLKKLENGVPTALSSGDGPVGHRAVCIYSSSDNAVLILQTIPTFSAGGSGAITWPIVDRMKQQCYLLDYIPAQHHPHILDGTAATVGHANFYDCSDAIDAAMASITQDFGPNYHAGPEINFPLGWMYFSRTIEMKKTMTFTGHGHGHRNGYGTTLKFAANITGITVNSLTTYQGGNAPGTWGANSSTLRYLRLESANFGVPNPALNDSGFGAGNGIGHGIWCRGTAHIEHVSVQYFPQNGLYVRATSQVDQNTPEGSYIWGGANDMYVTQCTFITNGGCGVYIEGSDVNAGVYIGLDVSANKRSGIHDSTFINNTHIAHHSAGNGNDAWTTWAETPGVTQMASYYCKDKKRANYDVTTWTAGVIYHERDYVRNVGNLYKCTRGGVPAVNAPTGTSSSIPDPGSGNIVFWSYVAADPGIRVPPGGHAQSDAVWAFYGNIAGPPGTIYNSYPFCQFPYMPDGTTARTYQIGYCFWAEDDSAGILFIGCYTEGGQPPSYLGGASMAYGNFLLAAESGGVILGSSGGGLNVTHSVKVQSRPDSSDNARNFNASINKAAAETFSMQIAATPTGSSDAGASLAYVWDELTGTWNIQYQRITTPQTFTTFLNTYTCGRAAPLNYGNTLFTGGIWLGAVGGRFHSTLANPPTGLGGTGGAAAEYAAGDIIYNLTPTGVSAPTGWVCTTSGANTTTAWVAGTTYAVRAIALNDGGKVYVCIEPGMAGGVAWAPSTAYTLAQIRTNGGNTYRCTTGGTSAASGGPSGTGTGIADGTAVWAYVDPALGTAPAWTASTAYRINDAVVNGGSLFVATDGGKSAAAPATGPSGAGGLDGTVTWSHITPTAMGTSGPTGTGSYILDGGAAWAYKPPFVFTPFDGKLSQKTISDGSAFTLTPGTSERHTLYSGTMTVDRAVTLSTSGATAGGFFRITRTATGAFNLNVGTGPLKALIANSWCEVTYSGSAWYLSAYGLL